MVYMHTNRSNTHADPPLGSRWAQMWVHIWAQILVQFLVYVTKGNIQANLNHFDCHIVSGSIFFILNNRDGIYY